MSDTVDIDDYWEWDALSRERGWTDGLPLAPPTEERVEAILARLGGDPDRSVGAVPPLGGEATLEQIAIQCAMAGCLPEHAPVVVAALEAMLEPDFNLHGLQCTTNPCAPLTIVTGPVSDELGVNVRHGVFGGGAHANAAIGRAVRLILWNLGGAKPGLNDMSPLGQPAKYAFCVGENHAESPWPGLQTDFGLDDDESAVTVFGCQSPYPAHLAGDADQILNALAESIPTTTVNMFHAAGQFLLVLSINPARELARAGYDKHSLREWFYEHVRYRVGRLRERGILDGVRDISTTYWGHVEGVDVDLADLPDDAELPMVRDPRDFLILVTGGAAQWFGGYCPGWGNQGGFAQTKSLHESSYYYDGTEESA